MTKDSRACARVRIWVTCGTQSRKRGTVLLSSSMACCKTRDEGRMWREGGGGRLFPKQEWGTEKGEVDGAQLRTATFRLVFDDHGAWRHTRKPQLKKEEEIVCACMCMRKQPHLSATSASRSFPFSFRSALFFLRACSEAAS